MPNKSTWIIRNKNFKLYLEASVKMMGAFIGEDLNSKEIKSELLNHFIARSGDTASKKEFYSFLVWRFRYV